jgi:hypothetical protein
MDERPGLSSRVVFWGLGVSLALALGVAFFIYVRYVRYEPVATRHAPAAFHTVVHVNVQQAVVYEPFRKHLLHLFEAGRKVPEPRIMHLERKTTLELGVDMREAVFGFGPTGSWLVSLGGLFRREAVVEGAGRMLSDEGVPFRLASSPSRLVLQNGGSGFSVAEDGTLVLASSESLLTEALPAQDARVGLGGPGALASLDGQWPAGWDVGQGSLVHKIRAVIRAGEGFPYEITLQISGPGWDRPLETLARVPSSSPWALIAGLRGLVVAQSAPGTLQLRGELNRAEFSELLARLAGSVRSVLRLPT